MNAHERNTVIQYQMQKIEDRYKHREMKIKAVKGLRYDEELDKEQNKFLIESIQDKLALIENIQ